MDKSDYTMLRIREQTHRKLRLIAALSDERMIDTVERLAAQELERLEAERDRQRREKQT